jgi:hypothetical protein
MRYRVRSCLFPTRYSDNWETVEKLQLHESLSEGKFKPSSSSRPSEPASLDPITGRKLSNILKKPTLETLSGVFQEHPRGVHHNCPQLT